MFIAWRRIVQGYEGFEYPPPLTQAAKDMLKLPEGIK